jgi:hypothetical protein
MSITPGTPARTGSDSKSFGTRLVERTKQKLIEEVSDTGFGKALRVLNLLPGANPVKGKFTSASWGSSGAQDWRVRLSLPPLSYFSDSSVLKPLTETNHSMVFPYTPNVFITHQARYNALQPTHSNYPFQIYEGSQVDAITITGDFTVENSREAEYWIAAVHFLRSVTKMSYGESSDRGAPPPILKLNGYGDFVFNNVPVVITQFNVTLPPEVDYISVGPTDSLGASLAVANGVASGYAPAKSEISVTVQPTYSRDKVNRFSLDTFVSGGYLGSGEGYL